MEIKCNEHSNFEAKFICEECGFICEAHTQDQISRNHFLIVMNNNIKVLYHAMAEKEKLFSQCSYITYVKKLITEYLDAEKSKLLKQIEKAEMKCKPIGIHIGSEKLKAAILKSIRNNFKIEDNTNLLPNLIKLITSKKAIENNRHKAHKTIAANHSMINICSNKLNKSLSLTNKCNINLQAHRLLINKMESVNRDKNSHNIINNSLDIQKQSHLFELYTESDWENKYNEIVSHYEDKSVDAALPLITVLENIASTLSISQNKLSNEDTIAIAYALRKNIALESLTLSYNKIDKVGANALAAALTINCTLTYLDLDSNNISNEGAKSIGQMLRINNSIATLSLDYNCIGDKGANAIAIGLKNNKALASLKLSNNQITEFGAASLLIIIYKINSCLGSLDLKGNSISGEMKSLMISSKGLFCILKI